MKPSLLNAIMSVDHLFATAAYERYAEATGGLNFRGEPMPQFHQLPDKQRDAWLAAITPLIPVSATKVLHALNGNI
jgi:hypothetical protein